MRAISLFQELEFSSAISKDAYLKANKWIAINIINKDYKNVVWKIDKLDEKRIPTFKISLYCETDIIELFKNRCQACKAFHSSFYINQQFNCDKCNANALINNTEDKLKIIKQYYKERIIT